MIFIRIFLLLFTFNFISYKYSFSEEIESKSKLWQAWKDTSLADTTRFLSLHEYIGKNYLFVNTDSAIYFAEIAYQFSKNLSDKKYASLALNLIGISYQMKNDYFHALKYYNQALELKKGTNDIKGLANIYNNLGAVYKKINESELALEHYSKSLALRENDELGKASVYNNIAGLYSFMGEQNKALIETQKAFEIYNRLNNISGKAVTFNNLGIINKELGNLDTALAYIFEGLNLFEQVTNASGKISSLNNISEIYLEKGNFREANIFAQKANIEALKFGSIAGITKSFENLYIANKSIGNYNEALKMLEKFRTFDDSLSNEKIKEDLTRQKFKFEYDKKVISDSLNYLREKEVSQLEISKQKTALKAKRNEQIGLIILLCISFIFGFFIYRRYKVTQQQKEIIANQKILVDEQRKVLENKNLEILSSINYAKRIQSAILPPENFMSNFINDFFVFYLPKDIVAGDFYWFHKVKDTNENQILIAVADCTGHGVPGALVSIVCNNALNRCVREHGLTKPAEILDKTREILIKEFEKSEDFVNDGMDIALCSLKTYKNQSKIELEYAGANNPLWIKKNEEEHILELKGDKQPIGNFTKAFPFTNHIITLKKGDIFYLFSDGFQDQFGGEKGKKFKTSQLRKLLVEISNLKLDNQKIHLMNVFNNWKGKNEQVDDICIIGIKV